MSGHGRNILVGISMATGLLLLGVMLLKFGDLPAELAAPARFQATFRTQRADGLFEGSLVLYRGVTVGRVVAVGLRGQGADQLVEISTLINESPPLPANLEGVISSQLLGGSSVLTLEVKSGEQPKGTLQAGARLEARFVGVNLLPPEIAALATDLRLLSQKFREAKLLEHLDELVVSARLQLDRAGKAIDSVATLIDDPEMRQNIRASVANFRAATETARTVGENLNHLASTATTQVAQVGAAARSLLEGAQKQLDTVARQMADAMVSASRLLGELEAAGRKLNDGKGTAAQLLNNAALYESLVDVSKNMNITILDLRRLIQQWEQEGLPLRMK